MFSLSTVARKNWLASVLLLVLCAAMFLPGLGTSTVSRQQELRVLLASRDMAEGGSWLIPHFMGEERLRKPPLMYWIVATAFEIAGTTESATAARLPSAVAGTALVLATFLYGRNLVGRRAAFLGAFVLLTSVGFVRHARLAETDLSQTLFCSLAIFSLYSALSRRKGTFVHFCVAGIFAGIGFMVKGPASVAMPLAAVLVFLAVEKMTRRRLPYMRGAIATVLICAAIAAPWYIAVAMKTSNTDAQASDEIARLLHESAHKGPIVYYVWTLPARMGIWALALPVAIFGAWKKLRHHRGPRFALCWLASSFAILSALSSKQSHYALLLFAPSALLIGWLLSRASRFPTVGKKRDESFQSMENWKAEVEMTHEYARRGFLTRFALYYLVVLSAIGTMGCAFAFALVDPHPYFCTISFIIFAVMTFDVWQRLRARGDVLIPMLMLSFAIAVATGFYSIKLAPSLDGDLAIGEIIARNSGAVRDAKKFFVTGPHASIAAWHAHRAVEVSTNSPTALWSEMNAGDVMLWSSRKKLPNALEVTMAGLRHEEIRIMFDKPDALLASGAVAFDSQKALDVRAFLFRKTDGAKR